MSNITAMADNQRTFSFYCLLLCSTHLNDQVTTPRGALSKTFKTIVEEQNVDTAVLKFREHIDVVQTSLPDRRDWMDGGFITKERITPDFVNALRFGYFMQGDPNTCTRGSIGQLQVKNFMPVNKAGGIKLDSVDDLVQGWTNFALVLSCVEARPLEFATPTILHLLAFLVDKFTNPRGINRWVESNQGNRPWLLFALNEKVEEILRSLVTFAWDRDRQNDLMNGRKIPMPSNHPVRTLVDSFKDEVNHMTWYNTMPAFFEQETLHFRIYFPCVPSNIESSEGEESTNNDSESEEEEN